MTRWRAVREAVDHQVEELCHRRERRMGAKAGVVFKLQQRDMVGKAPQPDTQRGQAPLDGMERHQQEPPQV
jgi:hypothetical protein